MHKIRRISPVLIAMAVFGLFYSCSFKPSPKKTVEDMLNVKNNGDVMGMLGYFSDEAVLEIPMMQIMLEGKDGIRNIAQYDSAVHSVMTPSNFTISGDTVFCSITEHNDWIDAAEIPDAYYPKNIFVVRDGMITYANSQLADSSKENFEKVLDQFVFWGNEKYPQKMKTMAPMGEFVYSAENGTMVVEMLREWKAEQKEGISKGPTGMMPRRKDKAK